MSQGQPGSPSEFIGWRSSPSLAQLFVPAQPFPPRSSEGSQGSQRQDSQPAATEPAQLCWNEPDSQERTQGDIQASVDLLVERGVKKHEDRFNRSMGLVHARNQKLDCDMRRLQRAVDALGDDDRGPVMRQLPRKLAQMSEGSPPLVRDHPKEKAGANEGRRGISIWPVVDKDSLW
jgi:hypothetical protein